MPSHTFQHCSLGLFCLPLTPCLEAFHEVTGECAFVYVCMSEKREREIVYVCVCKLIKYLNSLHINFLPHRSFFKKVTGGLSNRRYKG